MNAREIELIRQSWAQIEPIADAAARIFYGRLFELNPRLETLFADTDMEKQRRKLMQTLTVVVGGIDRLGELLAAVQSLGRRHAGYGVRDEDYRTVGDALLCTLEQRLGSEFTPEARAAWAHAYGVLAAAMQQADCTASGDPLADAA